MQQTRDRDDEAQNVDAAFSDPAFAGLKARNAPFAILRPATGEVVWANAAAATFWNADSAAGLADTLLGADGRGGWLDGFARGLVPDRPPRLARAGLARGIRMRAHTALIRAWTEDGVTLVGVAVSDAVPDAAPAVEGDAWLSAAWAQTAAPVEDERGVSDGKSSENVPHGTAVSDGSGPGGSGAALARRGHLAVLRDRLSRALDGGTTLRMLWRTDAADAVMAIDARASARLGSPLRFHGGTLSEAVAPFDPDGAERLRAAFASRATFAGISFDLPVADGAAAVPMALSGSPVFGPERAFAGFRGFGTVDLGRLALTTRRAPADEAESAPADGSVVAAGTPVHADSTFAPELPEAAPAEPAVPAEAVAPERPEPAANVVQLRAFQGSASGRFGAVPPSLSPEASETSDASEASDAETGDRGPRGEGAPGTRLTGEGPVAPEDGALSDQLAFLALGEALRARIGVPTPAVEPLKPEAPAAAEAAAAEPASAMLDRLPVAVLATVDGRAIFANPAAAARLGYPDARALLAAAAVSAAEVDRIALGDARGETVTLAARRAEVSWSGTPATLWLLGEPEGATPAPVEARAHARAGIAPAEGDDRAVDLLDRVDDAVALLDSAGHLRRFNRRGEGWFGRLDPEVPPSRSLAELLAPDSRPAALALIGEVRNGRDGLGAPPLKRDVVARTAAGADVPMLLTVGRLGASGFYATLRDVSALQRAEIDRARTERDRARAAGRLPDLLAKVSHEIRTPLGAILGFAEVMMDERFGPLGNPRYKDYLKDIHASGAQVVALVDDLLDLSRIEAGHLDLDVAAVDINRVVTEAVAQMQPEAHRERVIMRTSLAGRVPSVLADERSARQIVKNLLSNAVKFNEPGGQVIVSTALGDGEGVLLRVRDTGVGMSEEAIAAALEPFGGLPARGPAQSDAARSGAGNGLGLPLTRALVGANGASMTIRSRPREGTLVEISFAAAADEGGARRPA